MGVDSTPAGIGAGRGGGGRWPRPADRDARRGRRGGARRALPARHPVPAPPSRRPARARRRPPAGDLPDRDRAVAPGRPRGPGRPRPLPARHGPQPPDRRTAQDGPPAHLGGLGRARGGGGSRAEPAPDRPPRRGGQDRAGADRRAPPTATGSSCYASTSARKTKTSSVPISGWTAYTSTGSSSAPASASRSFWSASRNGRDPREGQVDHGPHLRRREPDRRPLRDGHPPRPRRRSGSRITISPAPTASTAWSFAESVQRGFKRMAGTGRGEARHRPSARRGGLAGPSRPRAPAGVLLSALLVFAVLPSGCGVTQRLPIGAGPLHPERRAPALGRRRSPPGGSRRQPAALAGEREARTRVEGKLAQASQPRANDTSRLPRRRARRARRSGPTLRPSKRRLDHPRGAGRSSLPEVLPRRPAERPGPGAPASRRPPAERAQHPEPQPPPHPAAAGRLFGHDRARRPAVQFSHRSALIPKKGFPRSHIR